MEASAEASSNGPRERSHDMRKKIGLAAAGLLAAIAVSAGVLVAIGLPGAASAQDSSPPPGMYEACQRMNAGAMEGMHDGMMNGTGQMGEWMSAGEHCPH